MLIQWWRWRGWRWGFFLPRIMTVESNIEIESCPKIFLVGAPVWLLLQFLALVCTVFSEAKWKLQNKVIHSWNNWKTFCDWTQCDMQMQSEVVFINYNQGKSPWGFGKVNVKFTFPVRDIVSQHLCLYQMEKKIESVNNCQFLHCLLVVVPLVEGGERARTHVLR